MYFLSFTGHVFLRIIPRRQLKVPSLPSSSTTAPSRKVIRVVVRSESRATRTRLSRFRGASFRSVARPGQVSWATGSGKAAITLEMRQSRIIVSSVTLSAHRLFFCAYLPFRNDLRNRFCARASAGLHFFSLGHCVCVCVCRARCFLCELPW